MKDYNPKHKGEAYSIEVRDSGYVIYHVTAKDWWEYKTYPTFEGEVNYLAQSLGLVSKLKEVKLTKTPPKKRK